MVPRILVGVVPYFVYKGIVALLKNVKGKKVIALPIAGVCGAFTNTLLVMNMIYIFFKDEFAVAKDIAVETVYDVILGIIAANGVPEAIVAAVLGTAVSLVLLRMMPRD